MKFSELVRLLEENGFKIIKEKGSLRYYGKPGWNKLIRHEITVPGLDH
jgi:predicted RNA binding protein YcfA (HicA-like mRNA interferase family)